MPRVPLSAAFFSAALVLPSLLSSALRADPAAQAVNAFGLSLLRSLPGASQNQLLSPYSIHSALSMTATGAGGRTLAEMLTVLQLPEDTLHTAHQKLRADLASIEHQDTELRARYTAAGQPSPSPTTLRTANRLFGERSFSFLPEFLAQTESRYGATLEPLDFQHHHQTARQTVNRWVEEQTLSKIQDLLGPDDVSPDTSLILVNALYFRAPWQSPFPAEATHPAPFHPVQGAPAEVPTMTTNQPLGYARFAESGSLKTPFDAVSVPYASGRLQFLILLPAGHLSGTAQGATPLQRLEAELSAGTLESCSRMPRRPVTLHLPKLRLAPPAIALGSSLRTLGMPSAFDEPPRSADFSRMSSPAGGRLLLGNVLHKAFLDLDEKGTEAAAATAVTMLRATSVPGRPEEPVVVVVDRPFLFAIQHVQSGTCLFLGRIQNPRP